MPPTSGKYVGDETMDHFIKSFSNKILLRGVRTTFTLTLLCICLTTEACVADRSYPAATPNNVNDELKKLKRDPDSSPPETQTTLDCENGDGKRLPVPPHRRPGKKIIVGTVIGHAGTPYWSGVIIESDGTRYQLVTDYLRGQGRLPPRIEGYSGYVGTRVRVNYDGVSELVGLAEYVLEAKQIVELSSDTSSAESEEAFEDFFADFASAVHRRDREALKPLVQSSTEVSRYPFHILKDELFDDLGKTKARMANPEDVNNGRAVQIMRETGWELLEEAIEAGTKRYKDSIPNRVIRVTNLVDGYHNLAFFERGCDGKWRWIRYLD